MNNTNIVQGRLPLAVLNRLGSGYNGENETRPTQPTDSGVIRPNAAIYNRPAGIVTAERPIFRAPSADDSVCEHLPDEQHGRPMQVLARMISALLKQLDAIVNYVGNMSQNAPGVDTTGAGSTMDTTPLGADVLGSPIFTPETIPPATTANTDQVGGTVAQPVATKTSFLQKISNFLGGAKTTVENLAGIKEYGEGMWTSLKNGATSLKEWLKPKFEGIVDFFKSPLQSIGNLFQSGYSSAVNFFK